jgi:hypothetical protein
MKHRTPNLFKIPIMDTIKPQKPILINSPIPSQLEILRRMQHNYGTSSLLFDSIISPCAEEAERIICELFLPNSERPPVTIKAFTYPGRIERKKKTGYSCPKCQYSSIRLNANFCPGCGKPLKWV